MDTINLVKTRKELGLTQTEMGKIINVKQSTYSNYENYHSTIPLDKLNIISNKYDLSLDYLAGYTMINDKNFNHINIDKKKLINRLKEVRQDMNMTQREFAKELNVSKSTINGYENGSIEITIPVLISYAEVGVKSIDWLCCKK